MQPKSPGPLPQPDVESTAHSRHVAAWLRECIAGQGGDISFADYMHHALYAPGLGYYAAGNVKFGAGGDFVTAPEISAVFGAVVARQCASILAELESPAILEFGAGSGKLAVDVMRALADLRALPTGGYRIIEVSPDLRERQERRIRRDLPGLADRVSWLGSLPAGNFSGVVLANEVLDALPVERFVRRSGRICQLRVAADGDAFRWHEAPAPEVLEAAVLAIESDLGEPLPDGYVSDVCLAAPGWIRDVASCLSAGAILLFDYGVSRREYYAADRSGGWLRCHFRHRVHGDPLILPGIQDMTAWVDFSAVAAAAVDAGLELDGYTPQAHFLIGAGLDTHLRGLPESPIGEQLRLSGEVKLLTLPGEMGENVKCMALSRGLSNRPAAFANVDRAATL